MNPSTKVYLVSSIHGGRYICVKDIDPSDMTLSFKVIGITCNSECVVGIGRYLFLTLNNRELSEEELGELLITSVL
jgi:hypothetical protein